MQSTMFVQFLVLLSIYNGFQAASIPQVAKSPLTICAFNIQVFGVTKMDKPEVVDILIDVSDFILFDIYTLFYFVESFDKS